MMIEGFDKSEFFIERNYDSRFWYHNGGRATESSYVVLYSDADTVLSKASDDVNWMKNLPTEIVLDDWRFVHAGYDQNHDVEEQDEHNHMWLREQFYTSKKPIDPKRTILFGHTPTLKHLHKDDSKAGLVWFSDIKQDDGRSMAVGLDTCLYHDFNLPKVLAAYNIQSNEIIYQNLIFD
jgi:serine/threonine protein phosphatase 1